MQKTTIYETTVMYDLSKKDLRDLRILIQNYNGNNFAFEQNAMKINPVFIRDNLIFILRSFVNTGMFVEKGNEILKNYEQEQVCIVIIWCRPTFNLADDEEIKKI